MGRRRRIVSYSLLLALIGACGADESQSNATTTGSDVPVWNPPPLEWIECGTNLSCAMLVVPRDYADPASGTFELPVKRYRTPSVSDRIGSLLVNPGGPGSGGTFLAESADVIYSSDLLENFDIIGWDPRGTGGSTPFVDCVDDLDVYFALDPSPDDEAESEALVNGARDFAASCQQRSADALPFVNTENSARDIDSLRRALGEETISYFGFSYGSELGAAWASLFPSTVRKAVFDAAVDPELDYIEGLTRQAEGFESVLDRFFANCNRNRCVFMEPGETAEAAFDRIATKIETDSIPTFEDRVEAGPGIFQTAVALAMYSDRSWSELAWALDSADFGDGGPLLDLYDRYFGPHFDGKTIGNDIEAYFGTICLERNSTLNSDEVIALRGGLAERARRLGPGWIQEMLVCANWPVPPRSKVVPSTEAGDRIMIVGSTGDAATPLIGTRAMAAAVDAAHLVVVDSNEHTSYGASTCATKLVDRFLIGASTLPAESNC